MAFATMPSFSYNKGNEKRGRDSPWIQKDGTYFSTVRPRQKDLMIQMLSERLDEKDGTITELKETINDLKETIAGLRETLDEFQRKLFGTGSEKTKQDKETEETVTTIVKATNGQHAKRKQRVKTSMEIFNP